MMIEVIGETQRTWQNGYCPYTIIWKPTEHYRLFPDGTLERDIPGAPNYGKRSFDWRVLGAVELTNAGHWRRRFTLEQVLYEGIEMKHKNRKQKVHIVDYDHGEQRMWGSPDHDVDRMPRPNLLTPEEPWRGLLACYGNQPVSITGPFPENDFPFGRAITSTSRRKWYILWKTYELVKDAPDPAYVAEWGDCLVIPRPIWKEHIACIVNYNDQPNRYLVPTAYPSFEAESLDLIIRRLVVNGEEPRYCS
jgi:hypothetical protein